MLVDAGLAARIDALEARLSSAVARSIADPSARSVVVEVGSGAAVFARLGSPMNKVIGVGWRSALLA